jgi:hypothetical protein
MSPSPESTGGTGFTFEDTVVAFYFVGLLTEGGARGLPEAFVNTVNLQQASIGYPVDDIIIDATGRFRQACKFSLQAKPECCIKPPG